MAEKNTESQDWSDVSGGTTGGEPSVLGTANPRTGGTQSDIPRQLLEPLGGTDTVPTGLSEQLTAPGGEVRKADVEAVDVKALVADAVEAAEKHDLPKLNADLAELRAINGQ